MARGSGYKGRQTPKAAAQRRVGDRKHGQRAYDTVNAFSLRIRLDALRPNPPERPRGHEEGFDDDAIELAQLGRGITRRSMETTPAVGYNQWRPYVILERKRMGESDNLEQMYREYRKAVAAYEDRWLVAQREIQVPYDAEIAAGRAPKWNKGKSRDQPGRRKA